MTAPSLPPGAPPPPPERYTEPPVLKSTAVRVVVGLPLGFVLGVVLPFAGVWLGNALGSPLRLVTLEPPLVGGLVFCGLVVVSVPWLWRRGLRGLPIGLAIGAALPTLLLVACAAEDVMR